MSSWELRPLTPTLLLALALQAASGAPPGPPPAPVGAPPAAAPRRLDDLTRPLTGAVPQGDYEAQMRGAFYRSQSLQGPLDGAWTLKGEDGAGLYRIQLVDPGFGGGQIEGAWSDLRAAPGAGGFFTGVAREGARLTLQFIDPGLGTATATLDLRPDGSFAGEFSAAPPGKTPQRRTVTLVRP